MARTKRPVWEVEQAKSRIFSAALELFNTHGYSEVSMRRIAKKAGCSPTTIYNYYLDKDALYLDILKKGFEILLELLKNQPRDPNPLVTLRRYAEVYFWFSLEYPYYYDIMFSYPVPKYLDYVGTKMESMAWEEKTVALESLNLLVEVVEEALRGGYLKAKINANMLARILLSVCHGVISLHRSRVWPEVGGDFRRLYFQAVDDFLQQTYTLDGENASGYTEEVRMGKRGGSAGNVSEALKE